MKPADIQPLVEEAAGRIYRIVRETPVVELSDARIPPRSHVVAKLEQLQHTGSFKLRGATSKLMSLSEREARAGVVTSSTGNHGIGVAAAARQLGIDAEVFLSGQVAEVKRAKIAGYGARMRQAGETPLAAEIAARRDAAETGRCYVSPYNDRYVVAGQGTVAVELVRQLGSFDAVFVATGGGGLVSGIGSYLRAASPRTEVVACWAENSRVLYECLRAGRIYDAPELPTLSESTAGGVEEGSITFDLCREVVDRAELVSEDDILEAMRHGHARGWDMEGASGVALGAYFKNAHRYVGKTVAVVLCGGNPSAAIRAMLEA
ncbi:MAG: pyridoxal-phosphate dependent enzyme [Proteobacteria bacterium]|nr:pyridoxal-phosphate dependent enzyme [Pseudomonadota bacterium]